MPRPITYEIEDVLDGALSAFWMSGHAGCSIQMLVDATGMGRQSLYNVFGDKDGLFYMAIKHYKHKVDKQCEPLLTADANLCTIKSFMRSSLTNQATHGSGACFVVVTAFSPQADDQKIAPVMRDASSKVRDCLAGVLNKEKARGHLRSQASVVDLANYLYACMNGLSALAKTGGTNTQIDASLDVIFDALQQK